MALGKGETLVGMSILPAGVASEDQNGSSSAPKPTVLLVTAHGLGKRVPADAFPLQRRAGKGNIAIKCNPGDRLIALHVVCLHPLPQCIIGTSVLAMLFSIDASICHHSG